MRIKNAIDFILSITTKQKKKKKYNNLNTIPTLNYDGEVRKQGAIFLVVLKNTNTAAELEILQDYIQTSEFYSDAMSSDNVILNDKLFDSLPLSIQWVGNFAKNNPTLSIEMGSIGEVDVNRIYLQLYFQETQQTQFATVKEESEREFLNYKDFANGIPKTITITFD